MVQGTTVDQVRNHLKLHTAVRGIIVVMVIGDRVLPFQIEKNI